MIASSHKERSHLPDGQRAIVARFAIDGGRRIVAWDDAAARLLGIPGHEAMGQPCDGVVGGRSDFGRSVCGPVCTALKALEAGSIVGRSQMLARTADGRRMRLACDLTALPSGGALGRLHRADDPAPDLAHDLAGVATLTARVSGEPLQQGLRDALDFLLQAAAADAGEAFLAEPHGRGVVRTCHRGSFAHAFDQLLRFEPGEGFPGFVLSRQQAAYTDRLRADSRFLRTRVKGEGFTTYVCAPLTSRSDTVGCLALAFRRPGIDLGRVLDLLRWVGTPLGLVVDTALSHLRDTTAALLQGIEDNPHDRLPRAMQAVLQEMLRASRADGGEMFLPWPGVDPGSQGPRVGVVPRCPVLDAGAVDRCPPFSAGSASILHGHRKDWPLVCRAAPHPGGAWCCVPMSCDGVSVGVVRLLYRHVRPSPPHECVAQIEGLASLVAEKACGVREQLARAPHTEARRPGPPRRGMTGLQGTGDRAVRQTAAASTRDAATRDAAARVRVRCFGSLELSVDGSRVDPAAIRRKRVLTVLAILITHHDQPQCKDALIERLWPGADPGVRARQLHVLIHELRRLLEPHARVGNWVYVRNRGDRYTFDTRSSCWIDVLQFGSLLGIAREAEATHDEPAAIGAYEEAVALYRGDYLQDEPFAEWCWQTREQLREACLGMLGRLSALWGRQGHWDRSVAWSRRAVALDPLREDMHRALMYALWASGRRVEAVRQYEACAHLLRERLDLAPLPETEQLFARIRAASRPRAGD